MLVLTRKLNEGITLTPSTGSEPIHIVVLSVHGNTVRLGIEAPASVSVYRDELILEAQEANQKAAQSTHSSQPSAQGTAVK